MKAFFKQVKSTTSKMKKDLKKSYKTKTKRSKGKKSKKNQKNETLPVRRSSGVMGAPSKISYATQRQKTSHQCDLSKHLKEGDKVPEVTLKMRVRTAEDTENPFDWKDMKTSELFGDKRVIVFGLPGAFTPTCTNSQVPGYHKLYDELRSQGIDEVYCVSVNDAFVMRRWGLSVLGEDCEDKTPGSLGFKTVKFLPDGACAFTRAMGMSCMWDSERGFGERSWRYAAIFDNMKIEYMFIEGPMKQNSKDDPFEVSSAENVLTYLKSKRKVSVVITPAESTPEAVADAETQPDSEASEAVTSAEASVLGEKPEVEKVDLTDEK